MSVYKLHMEYSTFLQQVCFIYGCVLINYFNLLIVSVNSLCFSCSTLFSYTHTHGIYNRYGISQVCRIWGSLSGSYEVFFFFWDITPCSPLNINLCVGGTYRLHLHSLRISHARNQHEARSRPKHRLALNGLYSVTFWKIDLFTPCVYSDILVLELIEKLVFVLWTLAFLRVFGDNYSRRRRVSK
jgi:hypothetical protein